MIEHIPILKKGDVKIDSEDLIELISILEYYECILANNLDILSADEEKEFHQNLESCSVLKYKYIIMADCRRQEHLWYEIVKMIDNGSYDKHMEPEEALISNLKADGIEHCLNVIKSSVIESRELPEYIPYFIGVYIKIFGYDDMRRAVWGEYLQVKGEREKIKRRIERPHGEDGY